MYVIMFKAKGRLWVLESPTASEAMCKLDVWLESIEGVEFGCIMDNDSLKSPLLYWGDLMPAFNYELPSIDRHAGVGGTWKECRGCPSMAACNGDQPPDWYEDYCPHYGGVL